MNINKKKIKKWLAFGCTHVPYQDQEAIGWLLKTIEEYKPDYVIHLGDLFEAASASKFQNEETHTLSDEFKEANNLLSTIRKISRGANRKTTCVFVPGNHDWNLLSINRIDPQLRSLCDWRNHQLFPEIHNWSLPCKYEFDRNRGIFTLGQCTFSHGYTANASAGEMEAILLSHPHYLSVQAHTHRGLPVTQAMRTKIVALPYYYTNVGCLRNLDPNWCQRLNTMRWTQSLCLGDTLIDQGKTSCRPRHSTTWSAETLIYKTKSDFTKTNPEIS